MSTPAGKVNNLWLRGGFVLAVAILASAALGLNLAVSSLQLHFKKQPVPLAAPLSSLPLQMGPWVQVSMDQPLEKDVADALATDKYIFRDYIDTRIFSPDIVKAFDGKSPNERKAMLTELQMHRPDGVINLAVTYYTGLVDTVAHIPDRCYIADGYEPSEYETAMWDLGSGRLGKKPGDDQRLAVRFINFEDQTAAGRVTRHVAYLFFTDGHYESDPLGVRKTLQNLRYRHGFYSKIELMTIIRDHDQAQKVTSDFLADAIPHIEACMPDWNRVEYGTASH